MSKVDNILHDFLDSNKLNSAIKAGGILPDVTETSVNSLFEQLKSSRRTTVSILYVVVLMFIAIFALGIYFALYYRDRPETMGVVFGGTFLSLLTVIYGLQRLWKQKAQMDYLIILIPNLPKKDVVAIIQTLLFNKKSIS